ncbi:DUF962 domain-containing protein [Pleionea sp. CnH1-48]|uniref:Mpo1 family 2-hydroxy fatty acid dioxygenase n=1 Tax=Pleionea sp. CnH1-48 TaxID=2954494 RepID=UPI002096D3B6|nr:Mpo1-like protein [Pleionea sp. CnH1-48]MCO7226782.1 DUF962 domain-containing protein [Pleionea sp. CnH1-48]
MKSATQWFQEYGESHQNKTNKLIHWLCVPAIFWSVALMLWDVPQPSWMAEYAWLNWATLTLAFVMIFYTLMSLSLSIGMLLFSVLVMWACAALQSISPIPLWQVGVGIFVVAWILQFIGHHIEGKKPSFFQDIFFLLIGPAWLMGFVYQKLGISYR